MLFHLTIEPMVLIRMTLIHPQFWRTLVNLSGLETLNDVRATALKSAQIMASALGRIPGIK